MKGLLARVRHRYVAWTAVSAERLNASGNRDQGQGFDLIPTALADDVRLDPGDTPVPPPEDEVLRSAVAMHAGAVALCDADGVVLPDDLRVLRSSTDLEDAVRKVATVVEAAITGDVTHRPTAP